MLFKTFRLSPLQVDMIEVVGEKFSFCELFCMNANENLINRAKSLDFSALGILDYNGKIKSEISTYSMCIINKKNSIKDLANLRKKYDLIAAEPSDIDEARMYSRKYQMNFVVLQFSESD